MTSTNKRNNNIMNVKEIIDTAFGNLDENIVNFKLIQTVLFLLANQLRILERRVQIDLPYDLVGSSSSSFKVTEVKIHAKKKKSTNIKQGAIRSKKKTDTSFSNKAIENVSVDKASISKSSGEKSTTNKSYDGKTSTPSMEKTSGDKSSTDKSLTEKYISDKSRQDKNTSNKTPQDKADQSTKDSFYKSPRHKTNTEKISKHIITRDNFSPNENRYGAAINEKSSETSRETTSGRSKDRISNGDERKLADNLDILEVLVEKTEKELRVIHQRADSHEQPAESPTPMASLDTLETQNEKLIVVERVSRSSKTDKRRARDGSKISVVTQEEFRELADIVNEIHGRLEPIGTAKFPENAKLMAELRKTASLTDAMAALQLSARLESAEKVLRHMIDIVSEIVSKTPGVELDVKISIDEGIHENMYKKAPTNLPTLGIQLQRDTTVLETKTTVGETMSKHYEVEKGVKDRRDCITYEDLDQAVKKVYDEVMKNLQAIISQNAVSTEQAYKLAVTLESKLDSALEIRPRMNDLENLVSAYAEKINALDTSLSSQMTNYQEQLTQMQHELEIALETMAETLANRGGDTVAMTELNNNFLNLQMDLENIGYRQREIQETQSALSCDLNSLWKQIEMLKDTKSDRDEVTDALRDKAGIGDLNGLITSEQFTAVRADLDKRILAAYDKFNSQEIVWQKAIDDFLKELNEKADHVQVLSLKDEINKHLNTLKSRIQDIIDIVGEPKSACISKKLFRDTSCLCCSTPATMDLKKPETIPALPMFSDGKKPSDVKEHDKAKSVGDGDTKKCYPGLPIPHLSDPRSHYCQRYCGGSHTLLPPTLPKVPPSATTTPFSKETCAKVYIMDNQNKNNVCLPCNMTLTPDDEACKFNNRRS